MKWGFKMSKEKEEQTLEAVAEEVTEEAESIEEEAKESFRTMLTRGNLPGYKYTSKNQYENKFQTLYQKKYGGS